MVEVKHEQIAGTSPIAAWAGLERSRNGPEHQRAINILESVLKGERMFSKSATSITKLYEPQLLQHSDIGIRQFWSIFSGAARILGREKGVAVRLVNLLVAIHDMPDLVDSESGRVVTSVSGGVYWRDLPEFESAFAEFRIYIDGPEDATTMEAPGETWYERLTPLLNVTRFAAEYLLRAPFETGMMYHATLALLQALECPISTSEEREDIERMYFPIAELWIRIAGKKIYEYCMGESVACKYPTSVTYGEGVSLERWKFWKGRFGELADDDGMGDEAGGLAASAVLVMDLVDGSAIETGG